MLTVGGVSRENVTTSAAKMGKLIEDLLAFSRAGRTAMNLRPVDSAQIVTEVRQEMEPDLEGRAIAWEIAPLPAVRADPKLLKLVWVNLLSNAVKYTRPRPAARVEIGAHPSEKDENMIVFYVRDNGVGFDMEYVDKIFGVFQRLHSDEQFAGTGIGLATVRRLVNRHGGCVRAEGEVGVGATFYFSIAD
ncbi:MAG: ATP-binding protein [Chloroflexota bacterium]|nr:ATP-binding protein [Chloroflexota bacterium]